MLVYKLVNKFVNKANNMNIPELPVEILAEIATQGYGYVYREMLAVPQFARFAHNNQIYLQNKMIRYAKIDAVQEWKLFGKWHMNGDEPAIISAGGMKKWYRHGKHYREGDQPAIIYPDGMQIWFHNNLKHRGGDLPAVISDNCKMWYQHGYLHRDTGLTINDYRPAVVRLNGSREWWYHGKFLHGSSIKR